MFFPPLLSLPRGTRSLSHTPVVLFSVLLCLLLPCVSHFTSIASAFPSVPLAHPFFVPFAAASFPFFNNFNKFVPHCPLCSPRLSGSTLSPYFPLSLSFFPSLSLSLSVLLLLRSSRHINA